MSHSHRRKSSNNQYFRMDVPKDVRDLVLLTSWQHSLHTSDLTLAEARRAAYASHYKAEVIRLRAIKAKRVREDAATLVGKAFDRLSSYFSSMDTAIASELTKVAMIVRSSWSNDHARAAEAQHLGEAYTGWCEDEPTPIPAIDEENARRLFNVRAELFEGRDLSTGGLVYQELARALLARGIYEPLHFAVGYLPYLVRDIDISRPDAYDAIAEAYLARLTEHIFTSWPENIREALAPISAPPSLPTVQNFSPALPSPTAAGPTLGEAFEEWKRRKKVVGKHKTADEFKTAIERFELLCGTTDVTLITTEMVETFGEMVAKLPARPKKAIAALPLLEQIAQATADGLPTLQAPTVGKQITAISAVLGVAKKKRWIMHNPAADVTIDGAKWQGDERDHFSDEDMRRIYASALMTDPDACSDTMFWILFLAPFHGSRPGEHCKLKPSEVVREDDQWIMRFRRDRRVKAASEGSSPTQRRQKTKSSVRDVPLHWIVLEGGFIDFVEQQKARGADWLFDDLKLDGYGDRYKLLSAEINKALRKIGITEADKSFYSTRHTMKREGRRRRIPKQSLDQFSGHASSYVGDRYGQGVPIETLKEDIDRLEFRSVPWDAVVKCARERVLRRELQISGTV